MITGLIKYFSVVFFLFAFANTEAQTRKVNYHPCFLLDSVEQRLAFIKLNSGRIFVDTFDCKEALLDSIANGFIRTKDTKYLDALTAIGQNPNAKVQGLYTDILKRFVENDFTGFIDELYLARGRYVYLQNEMIGALNIIIDGRPFKRKYLGLLNVEIGKASDSKDKNRELFLEKLKQKIEEEKYR